MKLTINIQKKHFYVLIGVIAGVFILTLAIATEQMPWTDYPVSPGDALTADMLNTLYTNVKNLTDIINNYQGTDLVVSGGLYTTNEILVAASKDVCISGGNCLSTVGGSSVPTGAVMTFYLASCPAGWTQADGTGSTPDLRGVFIRGLNSFDNGATKRNDGNEDPDGLRALGNLQQDEFESHSHDYYSLSAPYNLAIFPGTSYRIDSTTKGTPTTETGGDETRPRNVALIYCVKT